uniref:Uncharacterized protein n=1 Tax=Solanum tuberosum TaxID=4113 RepID=M1DDA2_SOLTU
MTRYAIMNEETAAMRKKHDVFNNDITMRLQKLRGKYSFFNQEATVSGPEGTGLEVVEEELEEEIVYRLPFQGRLKEGNDKITLEAHIHEYRVGAKVISCAIIYEHLRAERILKPIKGTTSEVEPMDVRKTCAYHPDCNGHIIEECVELKAAIRDLIKIGKIPYKWGDNTFLTCDQPEPSIPVTEHTVFYCHFFTHFKRSLLDIYCELVRKGVLTSIKRDDETFDPVRIEIWKPCPYHDTIDHIVGMCLGFRYDLESLINKGRIQVEFLP